MKQHHLELPVKDTVGAYIRFRLYEIRHCFEGVAIAS